MKKLCLSLTTLILASIFSTIPTSAGWHSGIWIDSGNGISAKISTPAEPLVLVSGEPNGVSNWVSTAWYDNEGDAYWIQVGWRYYSGWSAPQRYLEIYKDYRPGTQQGSHTIIPLDNQSWNSKITYKVERSTSNPLTWCGYYSTGTVFIQIWCEPNLHPDPVYLVTNAEIHNDARNNINTLFEEVKYKDPTDNSWKLVSSVHAYNADFPYQINFLVNYNKFEVIRSTTNDYFAPGVTD